MSTQLGLESKAVFSRFLSSIWLSHLMGNKSYQGLFWFPVSAPMRFSHSVLTALPLPCDQISVKRIPLPGGT